MNNAWHSWLEECLKEIQMQLYIWTNFPLIFPLLRCKFRLGTHWNISHLITLYIFFPKLTPTFLPAAVSKRHYGKRTASCRKWRGIRRELSPTTTANTWRTGRRRTSSDGWWTTRGAGERGSHASTSYKGGEKNALTLFLKQLLHSTSGCHFVKPNHQNNISEVENTEDLNPNLIKVKERTRWVLRELFAATFLNYTSGSQMWRIMKIKLQTII